MGRCRGKKKTKDTSQETNEGSSTSRKDQSNASAAYMDQEFDRIMDKTDGSSLLPSQNLLTEESLNERTLVDDEHSDVDFQNFSEGQV